MPSQRQQPEKPVWEVHARPTGASHDPWEVMRVRARSVLQAEAIMRRKGYEIAKPSAMKTRANPDHIDFAQLKPLVCGNCGYELSGLTIERASVICPECANPQPLMLWDAELASRIDRTHPLVAIFMMIGIITTLFLLFIFLIVFFAS